MKVLRTLALGLAAALAAHRWLPVPPTDPLRETLVWLPALVAGWLCLERASGGRRLAERTRTGEALALATLVVLALVRPHLALPFSDALAARTIAASFAILLAHRTGRQLVALRPLLGGTLPGRPAAAFFFLPLLVYLSLLPWASGRRPPDGDEPHYLLLAHSLAWDFDADLANNYAAEDSRAFVDRALEPQPGDPVGRAGELYSRHNLLLPLLLALPYRLGALRGAQIALCGMAAGLVWWTLRLARHYTPSRPGETLLAVSLAAFTAPLLLFSHQAWAEVAAAWAGVVGLDAVRSQAGERRSWSAWVAGGIALFALPLLKLRFALVAVGLLAVATVRTPRHRSRLPLLIGAWLLLLLAILLLNQRWFGNPLKYQELASLAVYLRSAQAYLRGGVGLLWDGAFGLFAAAPLWLVLLPALLLPRLRQRALGLDALLACGPYLMAVLPRGEWYGAWSPPFRYGVVAVPLLALLVVPVFADRRRCGPRLTLEGLGLLTLAVTLLWCTLPEWTYNLADGRSHWLDFLGSSFGADFARLLPSAIRPRSATWWWPVLSVLVLPLAWSLGRRAVPSRGWGVLCAFAMSAVFFCAAHRLPTRVVELEDAWVSHQGGALYPDRWAIARLRYRGGWALPNQTRLSIPIVPGGGRLTLILEARKLRPAAEAPEVEFRAGETLLGRVRLTDDGDWRPVVLGPVNWPPRARSLTLSLPPIPLPGRRSGALLDRLRLDWEPQPVAAPSPG